MFPTVAIQRPLNSRRSGGGEGVGVVVAGSLGAAESFWGGGRRVAEAMRMRASARKGFI